MKSDEIIIFSVETLFNSFHVLSVVIHQVPFRLGNRSCRMLQQTKKLRLPKKNWQALPCLAKTRMLDLSYNQLQSARLGTGLNDAILLTSQ